MTGFAAVHAVLWTLILVNLKTGQDVHMDVAEAFAWGQKFLLGYGKHPPLSGWVAGVWFRIFPVTDWATYALAMATLGCGLVICWLMALRVVDRRRAFFVVVMLALYPIFNFKGFKYNPDLLQLVTLPLMVLAYLDAFEKRSVKSGVWLGLAGALALMTKYWVLTMIGAIGLAALIHPDRLQFLRSPAPWVAIATLAVAMFPHFMWLKQVNFVPLTYAGDTYSLTDRAMIHDLVLGYVGHNLALLALPVVLGAIALAWPPRRWRLFSVLVARRQFRREHFAGDQCLDHPGHGGDRPAARRADVPCLYQDRLGHLAVLSDAAGADGHSGAAGTAHRAVEPDRELAGDFARRAGGVAKIMAYELSEKRTAGATYRARSELARELTQVWRKRFYSRWPVVAAYTDTGQPITFYSPDHPAPLTPDEPWSSGLTSLEEAKRSGFIGICETATGSWKNARRGCRPMPPTPSAW